MLALVTGLLVPYYSCGPWLSGNCPLFLASLGSGARTVDSSPLKIAWVPSAAAAKELQEEPPITVSLIDRHRAPPSCFVKSNSTIAGRGAIPLQLLFGLHPSEAVTSDPSVKSSCR